MKYQVGHNPKEFLKPFRGMLDEFYGLKSLTDYINVRYYIYLDKPQPRMERFCSSLGRMFGSNPLILLLYPWFYFYKSVMRSAANWPFNEGQPYSNKSYNCLDDIHYEIFLRPEIFPVWYAWHRNILNSTSKLILFIYFDSFISDLWKCESNEIKKAVQNSHKYILKTLLYIFRKRSQCVSMDLPGKKKKDRQVACSFGGIPASSEQHSLGLLAARLSTVWTLSTSMVLSGWQESFHCGGSPYAPTSV